LANPSITHVHTLSLPDALPISNTASTTSGVFDPDTSDNTATELTTVNTSANLALTKSDSPDPVLAGNNITYTLTVTNNGPSDATDRNRTRLNSSDADILYAAVC